MAETAVAEAFSEKGFYLSEFRGRTLAIAVPAGELARDATLESLLKELEANRTRVVVLSTGRGALEGLLGGGVLASQEQGLEGAVWRAFRRTPHVGVWVEESGAFATRSREVALRLGITKLLWVDAAGGLRRPDGSRCSFVDLEELRRLLRGGGEERRLGLLREIELALSAGIAAVNLTDLEGLADELFSYAGSGTLFTRERYILVRRLGLDDYDAADDLIARGVAEGYLAQRTPQEVDGILANGFGAFVEGRHLAGMAALLDRGPAAEISSVYTLTRFLGEGVGGHLIRYALERARERGRRFVFACTTSEPVARFFERNGFRRVESDAIPEEKWRDYDPERRELLHCLRHDL